MFLLLLFACTPPQPDDLAWSLSLLVKDVLFDLDERVGYENPEVDTGIYYPEEAVGSWERSYGADRRETWKGTVAAEAALPAEPVALCGETACPHDGWALDLAWTDLLSRPIPEHDLCQGAIPDTCHLDRTIPRFRMDAKLTGVANHLLPPSPDLERDISAQLSGQIRLSDDSTKDIGILINAWIGCENCGGFQAEVQVGDQTVSVFWIAMG